MSLPHISGLFVIGSDPELRTTNSGRRVLNFRAVANGYAKDRDNRPALWVDVAWWLPEYDWATDVARQLHKGNRVVIEGRIRTEQWDDPNGNRRTKTAMNLDTAPTLVPRSEDRQGGGQGDSPWGSDPQPSQQRSSENPQDLAAVFGNADDNPPF